MTTCQCQPHCVCLPELAGVETMHYEPAPTNDFPHYCQEVEIMRRIVQYLEARITIPIRHGITDQPQLIIHSADRQEIFTIDIHLHQDWPALFLQWDISHRRKPAIILYGGQPDEWDTWGTQPYGEDATHFFFTDKDRSRHSVEQWLHATCQTIMADLAAWMRYHHMHDDFVVPFA